MPCPDLFIVAFCLEIISSLSSLVALGIYPSPILFLLDIFQYQNRVEAKTNTSVLMNRGFVFHSIFAATNFSENKSVKYIFVLFLTWYFLVCQNNGLWIFLIFRVLDDPGS